MINITKQGNNVIVTSDNPNSFYIGNGELSVPLNTIYYVLDDESDFIQFNSTEEGRILFNGTIGQIQVNGNIVNRENILMELDNVFNSAATGGEGGTAGVLAINGYDGYINIKSVNGQSLIGSGNIEISGGEPEQYIKMLGEEYPNNLIWYTNEKDDYREIKFKTINGNSIMGEGNITIEGGEGGTAGVNKIIMGEEDYGWNAYQGDIKLSTGFTSFDEGDTGYDIAIGGKDINGFDSGSMWFGFRSTNGSLLLEDGGGRVDLKVNEWIGTQSEYDALGTYNSGCTYNIIEG